MGCTIWEYCGKPNHEYLLIINGNIISLFDSEMVSTDKLEQYLKWWDEFGGIDEKVSERSWWYIKSLKRFMVIMVMLKKKGNVR